MRRVSVFSDMRVVIRYYLIHILLMRRRAEDMAVYAMVSRCRHSTPGSYQESMAPQIRRGALPLAAVAASAMMSRFVLQR